MSIADLQLVINKQSIIIWLRHWLLHSKKDSLSFTSRRNATKLSSNFLSKKYTKKCTCSKKANSWLLNTPHASLTWLNHSVYRLTLIRCPTSVAAWCPKPSASGNKNSTQSMTWNKKTSKVATFFKAKKTYSNLTEITHRPWTSQHCHSKNLTLILWILTTRKNWECKKIK